LITKSSNPPTSGGVITNTRDYDSGWDYVDSWHASGAYLTYKTTSDFSNINGTTYSNHCAPTTGYNLTYFYSYNLSNGSNLISSANDCFSEYFKLMGTTNDNGTPNSKVASAYQTYFSNHGHACTASYISSPSWSDITGEISSNRPIHYMVFGHYLYGNHSVLGTGYVSYKYNTSWFTSTYSRYVQICDDWTNKDDRYVHFTVGSTGKSMVKINVTK
jgi:hypothetical protein